jgi:hypothetical protein
LVSFGCGSAAIGQSHSDSMGRWLVVRPGPHRAVARRRDFWLGINCEKWTYGKRVSWPLRSDWPGRLASGGNLHSRARCFATWVCRRELPTRFDLLLIIGGRGWLRLAHRRLLGPDGNSNRHGHYHKAGVHLSPRVAAVPIRRSQRKSCCPILAPLPVATPRPLREASPPRPRRLQQSGTR